MMTRGFDWGRILLVPVFTVLALVNALAAITHASERPALATAGTVAALLFYVAIATQYLRRGRASETDRRPIVWVAAVAATFAPFLIPLVSSGTPSAVMSALGSAIVLVGLSGSTWAVFSLGKNISIVPQARQVTTDGPYRWFRHPLYAFELIAALGLCLVSGGGWSYLVWLVIFSLLVLRATWEEELLSTSVEGYDGYAAHTPGLALPGALRCTVASRADGT